VIGALIDQGLNRLRCGRTLLGNGWSGLRHRREALALGQRKFVAALGRGWASARLFFLIDTWLGKEPVEGFVGITGKLADLERACAVVLQSNVPVLLAGGLSPDNVFDTVSEVLPGGADSCTHTNQVDASGNPIRFKKDFAKVEKFLKEIRRAENVLPSRKEELMRHLAGYTEELQLRVAALPAHSVRPHQLLAIEELEEKITLTEKMLHQLDRILSGNRPRLTLRPLSKP